MSLTLLLRCNDLDETRQFYQRVLGFNVTDSAENTLTVERQGSRLIFTPQDLWKINPAFSGTVYFTVADTDDYYAAVKDKAPMAWPLQDMSYGAREFGVTDCNGYHLAFQQRV